MADVTMLVVDDEPIVCETLSKLFNQRGYPTRSVYTAKEALELLDSEVFDVFFIDVNLPDMDGMSLLKQVKSRNKDSICFFVTGNPSLGSAIDAIDTGADGYFLKPLSPVNMLLRVEDALKQMRLERKFRDSEEKYRALVEFSDDHIFMLDRSGTFLTSNNMLPSSGLNNGESVPGAKLEELYPPDLCAIYKQKLDYVFEYGKTIEFELSFSNAMGVRHHLETLYPIFRDGEVWSVGGIGRDITDRKKMEAALIRSNVSLGEAQRIARLGTREWDIGTDTIRWSDEAYRIFGQDFTGSEDNHDKALALIHPDDQKRFRQYEARLMSGSDPGKVEYRIVRKDNDIRIVQEQGKVFYNDAQEPIRMLGTFRDVTQEKKLRQESEYRLQQIIQADKLASLGEVVAGVAHEINNPNSFITYNIPLLEDTWRIFEPIIEQFSQDNPYWKSGNLAIETLRQDMAEIIQAIKTGSDRINKVVSNLKEFARVDDSTMFKPVSVNQVIEKTMTIVGARVRKSVRRVNIDLAEDLPQVPGHFQKLEQVVANLVLNAANAITDGDSGEVSISTQFVERLQSVVIEVEDNGLGMSKEVIARVFDPFYTTRRDSGGTGLGLSVSYGLIQEHNGIIGVLSQPGVGSKFTVYLSLDPGRKLDLRPTILCVDDDTHILRMLHTFFVSVRKMPVNTLQNSEDVLGYLKTHPEVDIILSDIRMPKVNGWELFREIRQQFPLIRVVLYSGDPESITEKPEDVESPDYLLEKPFDFNDLLSIVKNMGRQRL